MSEINGPNFSVNPMNLHGVQKVNETPVEPQKEVENEAPKLTDFSDSRAEALGRSMLFKGVDGINNDLKAILDNPQIVENSDEIFETAYNLAVEEGIEWSTERRSTPGKLVFKVSKPVCALVGTKRAARRLGFTQGVLPEGAEEHLHRPMAKDESPR